MKAESFENMFYRTDSSGNAMILFADTGEVVTRLADLNRPPYPIDSDVSVDYEHPNGIVLSVEDAESLGIFPE
jgi:hypothetical protein